jgi:voltage-dependent potassium channel beta subunit
MKYNKIGKWGIEISELSLGSWLTLGNQISYDETKDIFIEAFRNGINFFDTAEVYAHGIAESILGEVFKNFRRDDIVVSTKIFWGGNGPNKKGLSKKRIFEGTLSSLKRLQLNYVDIMYCHRPDPDTPLEETLYGIDYLLKSGYILYWGTSQWEKERIERAHILCKEMNIMPPIVEQPIYNMFSREKVENEFKSLYTKYGMGATIFSPLSSGLLTGKYQKEIPENSRLHKFKSIKDSLEKNGLFDKSIFEKIDKLIKLSKELGTTINRLAIAWILKNENVSSVILGVSKIQQLKDNLEAISVKDKLDSSVMEEIEKILVS